jgi:hypothetical protein
MADSSAPSAPFDEPLLWPETLPWGDAGDAAMQAPPMDADLDPAHLYPAVPEVPAAPLVAAGGAPAADPDAEWRPPGAGDDLDLDVDLDATVAHMAPLAGLGGGASRSAAGASATGEVPALEPLPQSIWSYDGGPPEELVGMGVIPAPAVYAEAERATREPRWRRLDVRPGNAAVIALISVVSLVLLGMFLSVRARNNDVPTDSSQPRPPADQLQVTGSLNTIPITTTVTTTAPGIDIAGLVPAADVPNPGAAAATPVAGSGSTATTAPATRSAAPTGTSATTTPAPQSTATTAAPPATTEVTTPPVTSPPVTSPPVDDTAPPTTRRSIPPTPTYTVPTVVFPTAPSLPRQKAGN